MLSVRQCEEHDVTAIRRHRLVASGAWSRAARGVFDTRLRDVTLHKYDQERWRAVWLALYAYPRGIALSDIALMLHGAQGLPRRLTPEVALPGGAAARSRAGVAVRQTDVTGKTVQVDGRDVVEPVLALVQAMRTLGRDSWVRCADSLIHQGVIGPASLREVSRLMRRAGHSDKARWLRLVDGRAESPLETDARLQCEDAGIPPDDLQRAFYDGCGQFVGRSDLVWHLGADRWLVVEIDGNAYHASHDQLGYDALRQNELLRDRRLLLLRFRSRHLYEYPGIAGDIASILHAEGWKPGRELPADTAHRRGTP
ncbi:hypothetical protein [Myceligenerans halotolerans]